MHVQRYINSVKNKVLNQKPFLIPPFSVLKTRLYFRRFSQNNFYQVPHRFLFPIQRKD